MVSNVNISTTVKNSMSSESVGQNVITQICGDIKGKNTKGCSIKNVSQGVTSKTAQKAIQDVTMKTVSQTTLNQALKQMSKATVSNFNFLNFSDATNVNTQTISMQTNISNEVAQTCAGATSATNKLFQQCGNIEDGAEGCTISDVQQTIQQDITADCTQKAILNSKVMQQAVQEAEQTAVAKTIGLNPMAALAIAGLILLFTVVGGGIGIAKGVSVMMPLISAGMVVAGASLWVYCAMQKDTNNLDKNMAYFGTGGKDHEQPLSSVFPSAAHFPDVDYEAFSMFQMENKDATIETFCKQFEEDKVLDDKTTVKVAIADKCNGLCAAGNLPTGCFPADTGIGYPSLTFRDRSLDEVNNLCIRNRDNNKCIGWLWKQNDKDTGLKETKANCPSATDNLPPPYKRCMEKGDDEACDECCTSSAGTKKKFPKKKDDGSLVCVECGDQAKGTAILFRKGGKSIVQVPDGKGGGGIADTSVMQQTHDVPIETLTCKSASKRVGTVYVDGPLNIRMYIALTLLIAGVVLGIVSLIMRLSD